MNNIMTVKFVDNADDACISISGCGELRQPRHPFQPDCQCSDVLHDLVTMSSPLQTSSDEFYRSTSTSGIAELPCRRHAGHPLSLMDELYAAATDDAQSNFSDALLHADRLL